MEVYRLNFVVFFVVTSLQIISGAASAENYVSTNEVLKEIEKTLLFDQGSREEINAFAAKKKKPKKEQERNNLLLKHKRKIRLRLLPLLKRKDKESWIN